MSDLLVLALLPVGFLAALALAMGAHWLFCRLNAERCPTCGSKWGTELHGEWGGEELWTCHRCDACWQVRYPKEK